MGTAVRRCPSASTRQTATAWVVKPLLAVAWTANSRTPGAAPAGGEFSIARRGAAVGPALQAHCASHSGGDSAVANS